MNHTRALVREPGNTFTKCISLHPMRHTIDIKRARSQHRTYCETLAELGVDVIHLPREDEFADSCFVEDTAVIVGQKALICRLAKTSRQGEEKSIEVMLRQYLSTSRVIAPGTVEGGDIIHHQNTLICGITQRTNRPGVLQMEKYLEVPVETIENSQIIHLKSYVTYLSRNTFVSIKSMAQHPALKEFDILIVPDEERYAANTLTIGDTVLIPKGYPQTKFLIKKAGFTVVTLDMSEFAKCEGAITCLSLFF
ncbi:MAG: dimethylarginine dimethylaminohydrolase family protein [Candidatus Hermodarchaeota archaeon]